MARIQNNMMAANTHRQYSINNASAAKSAEKLSSGYKINRAGDDAAGLAISEKMRAQIRGLNMASKNSQDAISLVQTAEGALQEVHSMLQRMSELATQSATGTNENFDRSAISAEFNQLKNEINDISDQTTFNNMKLLDGSLADGSTGDIAQIAAVATTGFATTNAATFKVTGAGEDVKVILAQAVGSTVTNAAASIAGNWSSDGKTIKLTVTGPNGTGSDKIDNDQIAEAIKNASGAASEAAKGLKVTVSTTASSNSFTTGIAIAANGNVATLTSEAAKKASTTVTNAAGEQVTVTANTVGKTTSARSLQVATSGANSNTSGAVVLALSASREYTSTEINKLLSDSTIDADFSVNFEGTLTGDKLKEMFAAATTIGDSTAAAPTGGTLTAVAAKGVPGGTGLKIQVGANEGDQLSLSVAAMNASGLGLTDSTIADQDSAGKAITATKAAINLVSEQRASLGAMQNRLEHKIKNLDNSAENLQSAESSIRDVDMASEMTEFTKQNILTQAATAMLAQANSAPQNVLQLLR